MIFWIIFLMLHAGYVIILVFLLTYVPNPENEETDEDEPENAFEGEPEFVSVIIPFRNEEKYLPGLLHSLYLQTLPKNGFEVLVIDDGSDDDSAKIVNEFKEKYPELNLQLLTSEPKFEGAYKKQALSQAIASAMGPLILQTDADVILPPEWLEITAKTFDNQTVCVAGPVRYITSGLFSEFQYLELAALVGLAAAGFGAGKPFLANGANLAFRKSAFEGVGGYSGFMKKSSGDDLFLIQKLAKEFPEGLQYIYTYKNIVDTYPTLNRGEWWAQRRRWVSKSLDYQGLFPLITGLTAYIYHVFWVVLPFVYIWEAWEHFPGVHLVFWGSVLTKWLADGLFLHACLRPLNGLKRLALLPIAECMYPYYVTAIGIAGIFFPSYRWKGRRQR